MKEIFVVLYILASTICSNHPEEKRDPKWFFPTKKTLTTVVLQRRLKTEMIPSSCAVVEPTLQPCRNIRRLDIKPSSPRKILSTEGPAVPVQMIHQADNKKPPLEPSSDGGNWLWGGVTTVTQTLVSDITVKMMDPNNVVTFSVKGCKPTRIPFDLPYCKSDEIINESSSSMEVSSLKFRTADLHYIQE